MVRWLQAATTRIAGRKRTKTTKTRTPAKAEGVMALRLCRLNRLDYKESYVVRRPQAGRPFKYVMLNEID